MDGTQQELSLRVRADQVVMAMKGYSTFSKDPIKELYHQIQFNVISWTHVSEGSYPSAEMVSAYSSTPADWSSSSEIIFVLSLLTLTTFNDFD